MNILEETYKFTSSFNHKQIQIHDRERKPKFEDTRDLQLKGYEEAYSGCGKP